MKKIKKFNLAKKGMANRLPKGSLKKVLEC